MRRGRRLASRPGRSTSSGGLSVSASVPCLLMPSRVFYCVLSSRSSFEVFCQFNPCFCSLWIIPAENSNSPKLMEIISNNLLCFYWWSFSCTKLTVCDRWWLPSTPSIKDGTFFSQLLADSQSVFSPFAIFFQPISQFIVSANEPIIIAHTTFSPQRQ
jgi:hypothetical protein